MTGPEEAEVPNSNVHVACSVEVVQKIMELSMCNVLLVAFIF